MKSPKISEFSIISLMGMPVLCVALFVLRLLIFVYNLMTFNLRETKRQARVTVFLYCNYARVEPIFRDCFHQWINYIVTHWFCFITLRNP